MWRVRQGEGEDFSIWARPGLPLVAYPPACKPYGLEAATESATTSIY